MTHNKKHTTTNKKKYGNFICKFGFYKVYVGLQDENRLTNPFIPCSCIGTKTFPIHNQYFRVFSLFLVWFVAKAKNRRCSSVTILTVVPHMWYWTFSVHWSDIEKKWHFYCTSTNERCEFVSILELHLHLWEKLPFFSPTCYRCVKYYTPYSMVLCLGLLNGKPFITVISSEIELARSRLSTHTRARITYITFHRRDLTSMDQVYREQLAPQLLCAYVRFFFRPILVHYLDSQTRETLH